MSLQQKKFKRSSAIFRKEFINWLSSEEYPDPIDLQELVEELEIYTFKEYIEDLQNPGRRDFGWKTTDSKLKILFPLFSKKALISVLISNLLITRLIHRHSCIIPKQVLKRDHHRETGFRKKEENDENKKSWMPGMNQRKL